MHLGYSSTEPCQTTFLHCPLSESWSNSVQSEYSDSNISALLWMRKLTFQRIRIANPTTRILLRCEVQPSSHHKQWPVQSSLTILLSCTPRMFQNKKWRWPVNDYFISIDIYLCFWQNQRKRPKDDINLSGRLLFACLPFWQWWSLIVFKIDLT